MGIIIFTGALEGGGQLSRCDKNGQLVLYQYFLSYSFGRIFRIIVLFQVRHSENMKFVELIFLLSFLRNQKLFLKSRRFYYNIMSCHDISILFAYQSAQEILKFYNFQIRNPIKKEIVQNLIFDSSYENYRDRNHKICQNKILIDENSNRIINYNFQMEQKLSRSRTKNRKAKTIIQLDQDQETVKVINQLKCRGGLPKEAFLKLISETSKILHNQSNVIKLTSPIVIIGDIHGQFYDLLKIFQNAGPVPNTTYLFLGDYVDRGKFCIQVLTLLLTLKKAYPNNIFLLRGNHQGKLMTSFFNFKLQCEKKYNSYVYEAVMDLFKNLPLSALIDNKYFAVHGGLSPKLSHINEIQKINRFVQINDSQGMSDLLWSDPSDNYSDSFVYNKLRCCSYYYSSMQSQQFLKSNQLKLIIRGHQVSNDGYKYQFSRKNTPLTLTVFSAPNYWVILFLNNNNIELKSFTQSQNPFLLSSFCNAFNLTLPILISETTSLFKKLIKQSHQCGKQRNFSQRKQDRVVEDCIQTLQNYFLANSQNILSSLIGQAKEQQKQIAAYSNDEILLQFLTLKTNDIAQKYPLIIGPRNINFDKVNCNKKDLEQQQNQVTC